MPASHRFDVVVIGAGPAGMAAALAAAGAGRSVAVLDDNIGPGGQIWRGEENRSVARFRASGAHYFAGTRVVDQPEPGAVLVESGDDASEVRYSKLIVATGARERFLPFPGWTLPNVVGSGGLQALAKSGLPVAGKRVVVAGSGPLLPAVARYLRAHGAVVPVIAEQADRSHVARFGAALAARPAKLAQLLRLRPFGYRTGCWPVAAGGRDRVQAVVLRAGNAQWTERCDYLACGFGLVPNVELAALIGCEIRNGAVVVHEWQETSREGVYAVGETMGVGGLDLALATGAIAGHHAAGQPKAARAWFGSRARAMRFKQRLDRAFALRPELKTLAAADTIVCRCEDVPVGRIAEHTSWRSAKLQSRCGMGPCQGRVCGPAVEFLLGWTPDSVRPPAFPVPVAHLSGIQRGGAATAGSSERFPCR